MHAAMRVSAKLHAVPPHPKIKGEKEGTSQKEKEEAARRAPSGQVEPNVRAREREGAAAGGLIDAAKDS